MSSPLGPAAVRTGRQDAADLAQAESARLLAGLNAAAERAVRDSAASIGRQVQALLMGDLASATAADIQDAGRVQLGELAIAAAERWRQQQAEHIEQSLARLDERLAADLRAELDAVREAAAELLGLRWPYRSPGSAWRRICGSSTWSPGRPGKPNCSPAPSAHGSQARPGAAGHALTCIGKPRAWLRSKSAARAPTCNTGWPKPPATSSGRSGHGIRRAPSGWRTRCGPLDRQDRDHEDVDGWITGGRRGQALGHVLELRDEATAAPAGDYNPPRRTELQGPGKRVHWAMPDALSMECWRA